MKISMYLLALAVAGCTAPTGDLSIAPDSSSQRSATSDASSPQNRHTRAEPPPLLPSWYDQELSRLECTPDTPRPTGGETSSTKMQQTVVYLNSARAQTQFHKRTGVPENGYSILSDQEGLDLVESMKQNPETEVITLAGLIVNKGQSATILSYTPSEGESWAVKVEVFGRRNGYRVLCRPKVQSKAPTRARRGSKSGA